MDADEDVTVAVVHELPDCDIHLKLDGEHVPAVYDAVTKAGMWAFMCEGCWTAFGAGRLGLGLGQRLVLAEGVS